MSMFDGIEDVNVSKSGQYFKPGKYKVKIKAVKSQDSQVGVAKKWFIVETDVLQSDNPEIAVGVERSQVIDMTNVMALPNIKAFVAAASGVDPNSDSIVQEVETYWTNVLRNQRDPQGNPVLSATEEASFKAICELIVSNVNPLKDVELNLECILIQTKGTKGEVKDFTKHLWKPRAV